MTRSGPFVEPSPISRTYISQRLRLHYVEWGNPDAPPLVLLHGGRDHCRSWDWVARRLADRFHVIAPDLRGHGDSAWSDGSTYMLPGYLYDLSQLIHQLKLAPVTLVAHSLGGNIATRYAGIFPENVRRLVSIEGLGWHHYGDRSKLSTVERLQKWVDDSRKLASYRPKRYATLEDAERRMKEANTNLSDEQIQHLTIHGIAQNEDGTYSWKYDPYVRPWAPYDITREEIEGLWGRITCPVLLMWGSKSWHTNPAADGRLALFVRGEVAAFEGAGHWVHHDQLEVFMERLEEFLHRT